MTKMKNHKFGKMTFKAYCKPAGKGFEVGMTHHGKPIFVGNFIHRAEAMKWWGLMNAHTHKLCRTHEFVPTASPTWYGKYFGNLLYKNYYTFLDKQFSKYQKAYSAKTFQFARQYKKIENRFFAA